MGYTVKFNRLTGIPNVALLVLLIVAQVSSKYFKCVGMSDGKIISFMIYQLAIIFSVTMIVINLLLYSDGD